MTGRAKNFIGRKGAFMSENRRIANTKNVALSTGPKTGASKAKVSTNAVVHGLTAKTALLPGESRSAFDQLRARLLSALAPATAIEAYISELVVVAAWRLQRVHAVETDLLYNAHIKDRAELRLPSERDSKQKALAQEATGSFSNRYEGFHIERVQRYETSLQRCFYRHLAELRKEQDRRLELSAMDLAATGESIRGGEETPGRL